MTEKMLGTGQLITGAGGVLLIVSLFLPWAGAGGTSQTGFELLTVGDVFLLIVGLVAIATALTWKRYGLFRPDLSMNGAADLLGVVAHLQRLPGQARACRRAVGPCQIAVRS